MASVVFAASCCVGNYSLVTTEDSAINSQSIEIKVVSIISLVISAASALGIIVILCPCGYKQPQSRRIQRHLVQSSSVRRVIKCLTAAGVLANLGLVVRFGVWLTGGYPNNNDKDFSDYKHIVCVVTAVWTLYFFLSVIFWHVVYAVETYLASKGRISSGFMKCFTGWGIPAGFVSIVAYMGYHEHLPKCYAHEMSIRRGMFALYLVPVIICWIVLVTVFNRTLKEVKRSLIVQFGRFSVLERATLDNIRIRFIILTTTYVVCWAPNIATGVLIICGRGSSSGILVLLVLEAVLNPFQVLIDSMVMFEWPPVGCCGIFRSSSESRGGLVNNRQVRFEDTESEGESDYLLSFSNQQSR